jgi:hypothetical protein
VGDGPRVQGTRLPCGAPLMAEDAALYPDFLKEVTVQDLRLRFFSALREMAPEMIRQHTRILRIAAGDAGRDHEAQRLALVERRLLRCGLAAERDG